MHQWSDSHSEPRARVFVGAARRAREILRKDGIRTLWFKVLGETLYRRIWLFERPLDEPLTEVPGPPDIQFGTLGPDEIERSSELRPERSPDELRIRLARGERCYVARRSGLVIAQVWVARRSAWVEYLRRTLDFGPDDYYLYDGVVAREARGRRIATALLTHTYRELGRLGGRRAIFAVNLDNRVGLRALTRNGERRFALQAFVGRGRLRHDFTRHHGSLYWDGVERAIAGREEHYLDDVLAQLKVRAYGRLLDQWAKTRPAGAMLKTDLFEEANVVDTLLSLMPGKPSDAIGIDISPTVVDRARRGGTAPDATFLVGDVRHLPFAPDSIALIFSPSTLDHFVDPADLGRSLAEFKRVLAPDGVLVLTLDNRQNVFDPILRLLGRCGLLPYYLGRSYTVREMSAELVASGFDVTATTSLIQHPRLIGVATTRIVNRLGWPWLKSAVRRMFLAAERLENTRLKYFCGCFVAARAVARKG